MLSFYAEKSTLDSTRKLLYAKSEWDRGIKKGALLAGRAIQKRSTTMLASGARSGVHYSGLPFRSSAPGEYPRSQSGALLRSIYFNSSSKEIRVGAKEPYAVYLENGTKFMKARPNPQLPWLKLAMELEERNIRNYLHRGVLDIIC